MRVEVLTIFFLSLPTPNLKRKTLFTNQCKSTAGNQKTVLGIGGKSGKHGLASVFCQCSKNYSPSGCTVFFTVYPENPMVLKNFQYPPIIFLYLRERLISTFWDFFWTFGKKIASPAPRQFIDDNYSISNTHKITIYVVQYDRLYFLTHRQWDDSGSDEPVLHLSHVVLSS